MHNDIEEFRVRRSFLSVLLLVCAVAACSHVSSTQPSLTMANARPSNPDPWEPFNRQNYYVNGWLDRKIIRPLALLAQSITPGVIGKGIHNFTTNLKEPVVALNDLLQLRPKQAAKAMTRLVVNSTIGVAGVIDVAAKLPIVHHKNGFGDTLGRYGVGPGPYLYLPILGPSDLRDLFGLGADTVSDPINWAPYTAPSTWVRFIPNVYLTGGVALVGGLNTRAEADGDLQTLLSGAADPYATLRSSYLQLRQGEVDDKQILPALPDIPDSPTPTDRPPPPVDPLVGGPAASTDQPHSLLTLPNQQGRQADAQITPPLEQGQGQGKFGSQTEQRSDQSVRALLNPDPHRGQEGGAANGADETLQSQDRVETDAHPGETQGQPDSRRAGDPGGEVQAHGRRDP